MLSSSPVFRFISQSEVIEGHSAHLTTAPPHLPPGAGPPAGSSGVLGWFEHSSLEDISISVEWRVCGRR